MYIVIYKSMVRALQISISMVRARQDSHGALLEGALLALFRLIHDDVRWKSSEWFIKFQFYFVSGEFCRHLVAGDKQGSSVRSGTAGDGRTSAVREIAGLALYGRWPD